MTSNKIPKILYIGSLNKPVRHWRIESYARTLFEYEQHKSCQVYVQKPWAKENQAWDKLCVGHGEISKLIQEDLKAAFRFWDVIIFQKIQNKEALALIDKIRNEDERTKQTKILAEVDDHIGDITPSNLNKDKFLDEHSWAAEHCHISDGVICSTEYLANHVKKFNKVTHVAPNCVAPLVFNWKDNPRRTGVKSNRGRFKLVYVGASGHDEDIKMLYYGYLKACEENEFIERSTKLIIRSGGFMPEYMQDHKNIDYKTVAWKIEDYFQELYKLNADCAFAPLRDTEFNRCKSNIRWLEWATLGVPVLASPVEPFNKTNGKIWLTKSNSYTDWKDGIINFMLDYDSEHKATLRQKLKEDAKNHYNIRKECKKLVKFISNL